MPNEYDATLVGVWPGPRPGQTRKLWRIDGHPTTPFVVTSKSTEMNETFAFAASPGGTITVWDELPGSRKGDVCHEFVIAQYLAEINDD